MLSYDKKNIPFAKELRKNMTPWERKLWYQFLREYPIRFQRQKSIGNYIADFYCAKAKLIIELDRSQHYQEQGIFHDDEKNRYYESLSLNVLHFSNLDVDKNFRSVCEIIHETVSRHLS